MDEEEIVRAAQIIRGLLRFMAWYLLCSASVATLMLVHVIRYRPDSRPGWAAFFLAAIPVTWLAGGAFDFFKRLRGVPS